MSGWDGARRILAVRLDAMGDVLMTTPALRAIRLAAPDMSLTLLTSPAGAGIAAMIPEVDSVIPYEAPWMKAGTAHPAEVDLAMIETLRRGRFDAAVIFTVFSQNPLPAAMLFRLAGIPLALAHSRERAYRLLSDAIDDPEPAQGIRHEVRRQLDLIETRSWRSGDERMSVAVDIPVRDALARHFAGPRPWVLLHPGASAASRRYPAPAFGAVANLLADRQIGVVITAGRDERSLVDTIAAAAPGVETIIPRSLAELVALIAAAPLLIANNSGPAHIAAATGTPTVSLYAGTNPQHTPWLVPSRVLSAPVACAPCFRSVCPAGHGRCLVDIDPCAVADATSDLLAETAGRTIA